MRVLLGIAVTLGLLWVSFVVTLVVVRPKGMNLREARRTVPDAIRLLRDLRANPDLPPGVRRWLTALVVYLAVPFDLVPDFVPLLGYADDVIIAALVLRRVVRVAGPDAIDGHWRGSQTGLAAIRGLAGLPPPPPPAT
jgi:uncharacterized membrane protein YkvA (DUF1232 family)